MTAALNLRKQEADQVPSTMFTGQQFLETIIHMDAAALSGAQILTAVLVRYYSYDHSSAVANALLRELGSVACVLNASRERISALVEISFEAWATLQLMRKFAGVVLKEPLSEGPLLNNLSAVYDYLMFTIGHETSESCRILYLDTHKHLIRDEEHSKGTLNATAIYPREIVVRVCELKARAIIVAHNHPSGDPEPSRDDCVMTEQISQVLENIGATLYDNLIIGRDRYFSFRETGLLR